MILSDIIKDRRARLDISQADLAEMAGVSLATVKDIERGMGNPSLKTTEKILDVLGMEIVYRVRETVTTQWKLRIENWELRIIGGSRNELRIENWELKIIGGSRNELRIENWELKIIGGSRYELKIENWELRIIGGSRYELRIENWKLKIIGGSRYELRIENWELKIENWELKIENWGYNAPQNSPLALLRATSHGTLSKATGFLHILPHGNLLEIRTNSHGSNL